MKLKNWKYWNYKNKNKLKKKQNWMNWTKKIKEIINQNRNWLWYARPFTVFYMIKLFFFLLLEDCIILCGKFTIRRRSVAQNKSKRFSRFSLSEQKMNSFITENIFDENFLIDIHFSYILFFSSSKLFIFKFQCF